MSHVQVTDLSLWPCVNTCTEIGFDLLYIGLVNGSYAGQVSYPSRLQ